MRTISPLRYPGGKWRLSTFFERLLKLNGLEGREYVEPYAGGASLALALLIGDSVRRIHLNDLAPSIYSLWWAILHRPAHVKRFVETVPLDMRSWEQQRGFYRMGPKIGRVKYACSVLFLNRTNHSGILNGGVIGGKEQKGKWRISARFNRRDLADKVDLIWRHRARIEIHNCDALEFFAFGDYDRRGLIYLDPPYFAAGNSLYLNTYSAEDHTKLSNCVTRSRSNWVISYDCNRFVELLYEGFQSRGLKLLHTARSAHMGSEKLFFSDRLRLPRKSSFIHTRI